MPRVSELTALLTDDKWMRNQQRRINSTVNLLKTKKEELEHVKKNEVVLLERASRASARERRALQRALDEEEASILHHR